MAMVVMHCPLYFYRPHRPSRPRRFSTPDPFALVAPTVRQGFHTVAFRVSLDPLSLVAIPLGQQQRALAVGQVMVPLAFIASTVGPCEDPLSGEMTAGEGAPVNGSVREEAGPAPSVDDGPRQTRRPVRRGNPGMWDEGEGFVHTVFPC